MLDGTRAARSSVRTIYARIGDMLGWVCVIGLAVTLVSIV